MFELENCVIKKIIKTNVNGGSDFAFGFVVKFGL